MSSRLCDGVAPGANRAVRLFSSDPDAARQRMVEAAGEGVTLTTEECVASSGQWMTEEFDDIEFDAVALAAIAGAEVEAACAD